MLISLCGGQQNFGLLILNFWSLTCTDRIIKGICSGKHTIAEYLIQNEGFQLLELENKICPKVADGPEDDLRLQASEYAKGKSSHLPQLSFEDSASLLEFATKQWQGLWVTTDIGEDIALDRFLQRPFFLLVSVDAPISLRWKRFADRLLWGCQHFFRDYWLIRNLRCRTRQLEPPDLEKFVLWNDRNLYEKNVGRAYLAERAQIRLFNSSSSLKELYTSLEALNLADEQRLRPSWDQYFMQLASLAAQRSNCMKRRVGCVLVRDHRVISTGYNGTPRHLKNCNEGGCMSQFQIPAIRAVAQHMITDNLLGPRCNRGEGGGVGLSTCLCLHAEENALLEAGRERIREGVILYCDTYAFLFPSLCQCSIIFYLGCNFPQPVFADNVNRCPCLTCTVKIAQVGISEVVYSQGYNMDQQVCFRRYCRYWSCWWIQECRNSRGCWYTA